MRLERVNYNKIKIFLTLDDLFERGLTKEDIWKDSLKWHQLFYDMLEEASELFNVEIQGSVAVEVFSMHTQGMVMIVTMGEQEEDLFDDGFIDMKVLMDGNMEILFQFSDFEDIISLAKRLAIIGFYGGSLYSFDNCYYLRVENLCQEVQGQISAIMSEYGEPSFSSIHRIIEYGKTIMGQQAVSQILGYFA